MNGIYTILYFVAKYILLLLYVLFLFSQQYYFYI